MDKTMMATPHAIKREIFGPALLLRLEGLAVLAAALFFYWRQDGDGLALAILLLAPDISMIGYIRNPRTGAAIYNLAHTYLAPAFLLAVSLAANAPIAGLVALIWFAHIGLDRLLGYGLKYSTGFKDTHLSRHPHESLSRASQPRGDHSASARTA